MVEKEVQKRFFNILMEQKDGFEKSSLNVYQKLVFIRYEEVLKNSFLEFFKHISPIESFNLIKEFMKTPPKTPYVWQIPKDFIEFVEKNSYFEDREYLYELLYFDWIEIELSMKEYKEKKTKEFSWEKSYKLSNSARLKIFNYDILNGNLESSVTPTLIYFDFEDESVKFRETNPIIFELLKNLSKKKSIKKHLKNICKENDIELGEAILVLEEPLKELNSLRVFS